MTFRATIKNVGNRISPAVNSTALVNVMSQSVRGWGNGAKVAGPIPPGVSRTVDIPVYYLISNPNAMKRPVVFYAHADRGNRVAESNERNKHWSACKSENEVFSISRWSLLIDLGWREVRQPFFFVGGGVLF